MPAEGGGLPPATPTLHRLSESLPLPPAFAMGPPATPGPPAAGPLLFGRSKVAQFRSNCLIFFREGADLFMQIIVRDNNVDQALRALKKKLQREGVYREMKLRRHYEKPSEKRAREKAAAIRRARKLDRKRAERDGQR